MSGFSADWLALREPYDARARCSRLERALAAWAAARPRLEVADLGSGTGANLRRLAPLLPPGQRWRLIEHDPRLIAAGEAMPPPTVARRYLRADLAEDLDRLLAAPLDLVTASALLDLVSASWLDRLADLIATRRAAALFVLSWDGRIALDPPHADDAVIAGLVRRHQRTDKGFGPAFGPDAVPRLAARLKEAGGRLETGRSDWVYGPAAGPLHRALVDGWAAAAREIEPAAATRVQAWRRDRLDAPPARGLVGHQDLLWLPENERSKGAAA